VLLGHRLREEPSPHFRSEVASLAEHLGGVLGPQIAPKVARLDGEPEDPQHPVVLGPVPASDVLHRRAVDDQLIHRRHPDPSSVGSANPQGRDDLQLVRRGNRARTGAEDRVIGRRSGDPHLLEHRPARLAELPQTQGYDDEGDQRREDDPDQTTFRGHGDIVPGLRFEDQLNSQFSILNS